MSQIELDETINVVALDYFSKKLLTGSSSGKISFYHTRSEGAPKYVNSTVAHQGPVWGLEWAHPCFGYSFASCSNDGFLKVWTQSDENSNFTLIYEVNMGSPGNTLHFAPMEYGFKFAVALASGAVGVFTKAENNNQFKSESFRAHHEGCNAVSFFPSLPTSSLLQMNSVSVQPLRICTGGSDGHIVVWRFNGHLWEVEFKFDNRNTTVVSYSPSEKTGEPGSVPGIGETAHAHIVRDVQVMNNTNNTGVSLGMHALKVVSCSEDRTVAIWTSLDDMKKWVKQIIHLDAIPYKVSFSETGSMIAVSTSSNAVLLIKENADGSWSLLKEIKQEEE